MFLSDQKKNAILVPVAARSRHLALFFCNWFTATKKFSAASLLLMETALLPF